MPRTKFLAAALAAFALSGGAALAQDQGMSMSELDRDDDGEVSEEEFITAFEGEGLFGDWDEDGDGNLTQEEFRSGAFSAYDEDGDGALDEEEFSEFEDDDWF
jgi:Ca2+-binding EF-hand superfamily protein